MAAFNGKWKLVAAENLEAYLTAISEYKFDNVLLKAMHQEAVNNWSFTWFSSHRPELNRVIRMQG